MLLAVEQGYYKKEIEIEGKGKSGWWSNKKFCVTSGCMIEY